MPARRRDRHRAPPAPAWTPEVPTVEEARALGQKAADEAAWERPDGVARPWAMMPEPRWFGWWPADARRAWQDGYRDTWDAQLRAAEAHRQAALAAEWDAAVAAGVAPLALDDGVCLELGERRVLRRHGDPGLGGRVNEYPDASPWYDDGPWRCRRCGGAERRAARRNLAGGRDHAITLRRCEPCGHAAIHVWAD